MTHLVLVGLMATGKSTVGRLVAAALDRPLLDSDAQVEAEAGRTVREIWRTDGEAAFRRMEEEALVHALASTEPIVVAAAGGVVLSDANRTRLRSDDVEVVWLRARPETLLARVVAANDEHRPLLDVDPAGMLERMASERAPLYEDVADRIVDVDGRSVAEIARAVAGSTDG